MNDALHNPDTVARFRAELEDALEAGRSTDYTAEGDPYDVFHTNLAAGEVLNVLERWGLIPKQKQTT